MRVKQRAVFFAVLLFIILSAVTVYAHPGRTDSSGGHNSSDGYHWHHGYPAHNHSDLDGDGVKEYCPYDHDDATDHKNTGSYSTKSSSDSTADDVDKAEDETFHLQPLSIAALSLAVFSFFIPALFKDFTVKDCLGVLFFTIYCVFLAVTIPLGLALALLTILQLSPSVIYSVIILLVVIVCIILLCIFKIDPNSISDSILYIAYYEAVILFGSTIITQNIPSPSGAGTFFITLLTLCILVWIYHRFRPQKAAPK